MELNSLFLKSRLSLIVPVNVVLNRTVVVDSYWRFDNLCGSHLQSHESDLYHVSWWYYTLVIDLIGQLCRDVTGRLLERPKRKPYDRLDRLKGKRRGLVSDVSGWDNRILSRVSKTSQTWWFFFGEWTLCLAIFFFSRGCGVEKLVEFHEDIVSFFKHFVTIFFDFSAIQTEFILDYWNISGDFWDSLWSSR